MIYTILQISSFRTNLLRVKNEIHLSVFQICHLSINIQTINFFALIHSKLCIFVRLYQTVIYLSLSIYLRACTLTLWTADQRIRKQFTRVNWMSERAYEIWWRLSVNLLNLGMTHFLINLFFIFILILKIYSYYLILSLRY